MWTFAIARRVVLASVMACGVSSGALVDVAAAQPTPSPPETFIVYFDAGSTRPSRAASTIIQEAAQAIRRSQDRQELSHVKVIGYSDTVGSIDDAQRLSERRAGAVRDALVQDGIAAKLITIEGRGKKELAVATGDQVDQPRNRRVRIILYRPGD